MISELINILTTSLFILFLLGIISALMYSISKWVKDTDTTRGAGDLTTSFLHNLFRR
jgi:hypothetical protein